MYVAKTKALISFLVTVKLICVFVFAYEKRWFSHDEAHIEDNFSLGIAEGLEEIAYVWHLFIFYYGREKAP